MDSKPNVVIVLARCRHSRQPFGVRFEEFRPGAWVADWAFPIKESAAKREGYDRSTIEGGFAYDPDYPGCPSCFARRLVRCRNCGQVMCYDDREGTLTCPGCGASGRVTGTTGTVEVDRNR